MSDSKVFVASPEAKGKAKQHLFFARLPWVLASVVLVIIMIAILVIRVQRNEFECSLLEQYSEEINQQNETARELNIDSENVHWSKAGNMYHAYENCQYIKGVSLSTGSIQESWEAKGISELCRICQKKATKATISSNLEDLIGSK